MGWASKHIERLRAGETVRFRPHGGSMAGRIESGQLCTVEPVDPDKVAEGDVVLCTVRGAQYLHFVGARQGPRFQIANARGHINGWIGPHGIHGRLIDVRD